MACSFQRAAIDPLVKKTVESAVKLGVPTVTAGGGVAANAYLREPIIYWVWKINKPPALLKARAACFYAIQN